MRQKTQKHQNQRSIDKKFRFFSQSRHHMHRWVRLVQKMRAKNSHAWAPLKLFKDDVNGLFSTSDLPMRNGTQQNTPLLAQK
jgi:hypothetical protein